MPKVVTKTTLPQITLYERPATASTKEEAVVVLPQGLARLGFRLPSGKPISPHQYKVYDYISRIPRGKVSTYKLISDQLGSSAQAVGGALRDNPFQPVVPCHRIIATTLFIGGFQGNWANKSTSTTTKKDEVTKGMPKEQATAEDKIQLKLRLLEEEGVSFDSAGYLIGGKSMIWDGELS